MADRAHSLALRDVLVGQVPLVVDAFVAAGPHSHDVPAFEAHAAEVVSEVSLA